MTREEIATYVRRILKANPADGVSIIAAAWEADVNKAVSTTCRETREALVDVAALRLTLLLDESFYGEKFHERLDRIEKVLRG